MLRQCKFVNLKERPAESIQTAVTGGGTGPNPQNIGSMNVSRGRYGRRRRKDAEASCDPAAAA